MKVNLKKFKYVLFPGLFILIAGLVLNTPEAELVFDFAAGRPGWQVPPGVEVLPQAAGIQLNRKGQNFYVIFQPESLNANQYDLGILEMESPLAFDQGRLLFLSPYNQNFDSNFRSDFDTGRANRSNQIRLNLKKHPAWQGWIRALLILPADQAETVILKRIRFIKSNLISRLKAYWSDFVYYHDPLLGTCFSMASPFFIKDSYNSIFVPLLWWVLGLLLIILVVGRSLSLDPRISRVSIGIFFLIFMFVWGVLELRNNAYELKAIQRNLNLYGGKNLHQKRKIVTGAPHFIDFMKFCDENIPLDGKIVNCVPTQISNSAPDYLSKVQLIFNLKPRRFDDSSDRYYIYYQPQKEQVGTIVQEQRVLGEYYNLAPGEKLRQEIKLLYPLKDLTRINLWLRGKPNIGGEVEVLILEAGQQTLLGKSEYLGQFGQEAAFRFFSAGSSVKPEKVLLEIKNKGNSPLGLGYYYGNLYQDGNLLENCDLTFRLIFCPQTLKLYKRFSSDAFILIEEGG